MTPLEWLLWTKIAGTLGLLVLPFGLFPKVRLDALTGFGAPHAGFYRL